MPYRWRRTKNILTGGASEAARLEAVASQLPGRVNGPADAYRHLLVSGELTRKYPTNIANTYISGQENIDLRETSNRAQDEYNNEIGKKIGLYVREKGGSYEDLRRIVRKVVSESLKGQDAQLAKTMWEKTRYKDWQDEILVNAKKRIVNVEGQDFNSIALAPAWKANPKVNGTRINDDEANWPDEKGEWLNRFNYKGARSALTYKGAGAYEEEGAFDYLTPKPDKL